MRPVPPVRRAILVRKAHKVFRVRPVPLGTPAPLVLRVIQARKARRVFLVPMAPTVPRVLKVPPVQLVLRVTQVR